MMFAELIEHYYKNVHIMDEQRTLDERDVNVDANENVSVESPAERVNSML